MTCPQWMRAALQTKHLINKIGLQEREGKAGVEVERRGEWILKGPTPVSPPTSPPFYKSWPTLQLSPSSPAPDPPARCKRHQVASKLRFSFLQTLLPPPPPRARKVRQEEEVQWWRVGLQVLGGRGNAPGAPVVVPVSLFVQGRDWDWGRLRARPRSRRPAARVPGPRGGERRAGAGRASGAFPAFSRAVHVAPAAAVSAAPTSRREGARWWLAVEGVCFGRGSREARRRRQTASSFPW